MLHDVNGAAAAIGLGPGLRAADVAAATPYLRTAYADPAYESASLKRLAAWCRRWSPLTRPDGTDGIALDVTGCTHLFGGEEVLLATIREALARQKLTARLACAPCHGAAHALARFSGAACTVVAKQDLAARVAVLPIAALGLEPRTATALYRLGLKTVGQLARMPRPALKKRFGKGRTHHDPRDDTWEVFAARLAGAPSDVLTRLDGIHARIDTPLDPDRPVPASRIASGLPEPIFDTETVLNNAHLMIARLMAVLEARGEGVRTLLVEAFRTDGGRSATRLHLARATRDARHLTRLLAERLEDWRAEYGFDALAVEATHVEAMEPGQADGFADETGPDAAGLIDRLSVRLGAEAVTCPVPRESHKPERAEIWVPALSRYARQSQRERSERAQGRKAQDVGSLQKKGPDATGWIAPSACPRPERLFEPPEEVGVLYALPEGPPARFTWRAKVHTVARVAGPERIAPEWWRERSQTRARDYYRAEDEDGARFWLYAEGFAGDERGDTPRWFLHGLFS